MLMENGCLDKLMPVTELFNSVYLQMLTRHLTTGVVKKWQDI